MYTKPHSTLAQSGLGAVIAASSYSGVFSAGKQIVNFKQSLRSKQRTHTQKKKKPTRSYWGCCCSGNTKTRIFLVSFELVRVSICFFGCFAAPRADDVFLVWRWLSPKRNVFSIKCKVNTRQSSRLSKGEGCICNSSAPRCIHL